MSTDKPILTNPGILQENIPSRRNKFVIISILVMAFIALTAYFHMNRNLGIGYSHFAYIPIIFASFWWGRKSIYVAAVLGLTVLVFRFISGLDDPLWADLVRIVAFLTVAFVVGELSSELVRTHRALREREARLKKTNASLREFSQLRRAFLHIAIHDMKSPVSATIMLLHSLETLLGESVTDKQKHLMVRMHSRLDEAASFLRDFQLFAQLEDPSQIRREAIEIDLNDILSKVVQTNMDIASEKGHRLELSMQEDLPHVGGVERLLREVVENLVTNAIKYTPDNGRISVRSSVTEDGAVNVEVQDDGIGISKKNQKKLFREFVRIKDNNVAGQKVSGIGLGLSIVRRILDMHGGRVYVISRPEEGSIFGFDLPVCPTDGGPLLRPARKVAPETLPEEGYTPN